jgi:uncharacterized protein
MKITLLYAALLALLFLLLTFRAIFLRGKNQVLLGDGGHPQLQRAIRAHGNFTEYTPIALILLLLLEGTGSKEWLLHAFGSALLLGRILHAAGVSQLREPLALRVTGMVLTNLVILGAAVLLLLGALKQA